MVGAVTTKAQTLRETATRPLRLPHWRGAVKLILTVDQLPIRGSSNTRTFGCQEDCSKMTASFQKITGIVYCRFKDPGRKISMDQVVLSKSLRRYLISVAHDSITGAHLGIRRTTGDAKRVISFCPATAALRENLAWSDAYLEGVVDEKHPGARCEVKLRIRT
ncbi:hypothetical protein PoB_004171200 [Plakobranchus ocellatus]|uniref:Integrase zinc-binding domain-containing protein n=1 Tax=Plakobranchus ocellatus TaxID=259542 RepID=A0AAV4B7R9_9GAST|nr:hypothetical protein PoB_004171200 [Plakobranchus ocellatus]